MGKKCKRKVQWRRLSLNELQSNKSSEEGAEEEDCEDEDEAALRRSCCGSPPHSTQSRHLHYSVRAHGPNSRRPFHPNFYPADHKRFPAAPFDSRGVPFERGPRPRFFGGGRPFHHDHRVLQFPPGSSRRGKPFKFLGRGGGGIYVRGTSPYGGERGPYRRRWSGDDGSILGDSAMEDGDEMEDEGKTHLQHQQPVHTVLIDNEEYTKIQTPRQEVIFKKSSLDRKRDSIDMGSAPSSCDSVNGCDPSSSQGDQGSVAGSVEDATLSSGEDPPQESKDGGPYEDTNNMFIGEPGKPPLAGVVMQPAYPGGPMISIPVHWTPFLDPGLIPGDTALTPLDPAFTHVIDPKDLPADSAHILPVQHDSNGCPVTVQVKVNSEGLPIEIEPSVLTVSLSTLEPHQQEVLLRKSGDLVSNAPVQTTEGEDCSLHPKTLPGSGEEEEEEGEGESAQFPNQSQSEASKEVKNPEKSQQADHKETEECSSDSQYASMSEASTAPTTPSGELSDPSESSESSKPRPEKPDNGEVLSEKVFSQESRPDSLLDSTQHETEGSGEDLAVSDVIAAKDDAPVPMEVQSIESSSSNIALDEESKLAVTPESHDSLPEENPSENESMTTCSIEKAEVVTSETNTPSEKCPIKTEKSKKNKRNKKIDRSLSVDSNISSQNSCADSQIDANKEPLSKHQVKRNAKKLKKERKRSNREKIKAKNNNSVKEKSPKSTELMENDLPIASSNCENSPCSESCDGERSNIPDNSETPMEVTPLASVSEDSNHIVSVDHSSSMCDDKEPILEEGEQCGETEDCEITEKDEAKCPEDAPEVKERETNDTIDTNTSLEKVQKKGIDESYPNPPEGEIDENKQRVAVDNEEEVNPEVKNDNKETNSPSQPEIDVESTKTSSDGLGETTDENYTCKPGFVMVPILTPYYDPAVLYGYPLILPENPPERNYGRKKKKKFRKKYQEEIYLDSELYTGEPFIATPNGYMVPVDASQVYHVHGYQYMPNMYPSVLPDEGFVSLEHSPYLPESIPEPVYRMEMERHNKNYPKAHNGDRKSYERTLPDRTSREEHKNQLNTQQQEKNKDFIESCDSGVSESEDPSLLTSVKSSKVENDEGSKQEETKEEQTSPKENSENIKTAKNKNGATSDSVVNTQSKKKNKKQRKEKSKKEITEILEPDFSSFSTSTPRFESSSSKEDTKAKQFNKKTKNKKKKQGKKQISNNELSVDVSSKDENESNSVNDQTPIESAIESANSEPHTDEPQEVVAEDHVDKETETKEKTDLAPEKKGRTGRKKKNLKRRSKNGNDTSCPSTAKECLLNENFADQLSIRNSSSQESVIVETSDECLSQESMNNASSSTTNSDYKINSNTSETDPGLSQESVSICSPDNCSNHEEEAEELELSNQNVLISENSDSVGHLEKTEYENSSQPGKDLLSKEVQNNLDQELLNSLCTEVIDKQEDLTLKEADTSTSYLVKHCSSTNLSSTNEEISYIPSAANSTAETIEDLELLPTVEDEDTLHSFKDLGVTEAVRRWIREVTPQKAFAFTEENMNLILSSVISSEDESSDEDNEESGNILSTNEQPKNVKGNPFAASPSESSVGVSSEGVASCSYLGDKKLLHERTLLKKQYSEIDDYDGESVVSSLSRGRLYSTSSSASSPLVSFADDTNLVDDPRVYDPTVYSKYYQLGIDIHPTPTSSSTRESTLSPTPVDSDGDPFLESKDLLTATDSHSISLASEFLKSEKIRANMSHISPSSLENTLPSPYCGCPGPLLNNEVITSHGQGMDSRRVVSCSMSSSGIGSSLASSPNLSPTHRFSSDIKDSFKPKLEPHPLVNLSIKEGSVPCKAACCSLM